MSIEPITELFQRIGIDYKETDTQYIMSCPICGREQKCYMGKANLLWDCKVCGETGNIKKFRELVGGNVAVEKPKTTADFTLTMDDVEEMQQRLMESPEKLRYLTQDRKLSMDSIKKLKFGLTKDGDISIPHIRNGNLTGIQYRKFSGNIKYLSEPGSDYQLFNEGVLDVEVDELLVCEGAFDAASALTYGFTNVVAVPGCSSKKAHWIHKFKKAKKIHIAYDMDEDKDKGQKGAYDLATKIGLERCKNVKLPYNDMNDCLINGVEVSEIVKAVKEAENFPVPGICTLDRFESDLIDHIYNNKGWSTYRTGYENLDKITHGFDMQELRVVSGVTGAGKTTWITLEMLNYAKQGIPTAMFSLESPIKKIGKDLLQSQIDRPITELSKEEVLTEIRKFKALPIYFFDSREFNQTLNLHRFRDSLKHARDSLGIKFAVLDDMQFLLNTGNRNLNTADKITETVAEMKLIANTLNIHLVIIAHINRENEGSMPTLRQLKGSSGYEQLADYAMFVHRDTDPEAPPDIAEIVSIAISKNRIHGDLGLTRFRFDKERCMYTPE